MLIAAVFAAAMSSLSSAIGAMSSTAVTDLCRPLFKARLTEAGYLRLARMLTGVFAVVLVVVALAFRNTEGSLVWAVFKWVGLLFGGMLGVFLLGVLTKHRGRDAINPVGMLSSVAILVAIMLIQEHMGRTYIAWPWWIVIGTAWTFGLGACFKTRAHVSRMTEGE